MPDSDFGLRLGGKTSPPAAPPYQGEVYSPSGEPFVLNLTGFPVPLLAFGEACPEGLGEVRFYSP